MALKPIMIFDASGLNRLANDPDRACIEPGLTAGFSIRLTETNLGEVVATTAGPRREQLLHLCRRLVVAGDCIYPYHWITTELVLAHHRNPAKFDWRTIDVRFPAAARELARLEIFDDALAKEQRDSARSREQEFTAVFTQARPHFEALFEQKATERPASFAELVARLQLPGGAFWNFGNGFYERPAKLEPDEDTIRKFIADCPPFRALVLAVCVAQYEHCIRRMQTADSYRAGAFDLYSSVYLPYCRQFVTADERQCIALKQVAAVGDLNVDVLSYGEFRECLMVGSLACSSLPADD